MAEQTEERKARRTRPAEQSDGGPRVRESRDRDGGGDEEESRRHSGRSKGGLSAARAARLGLQQVAELTGKDIEGVAAVERSDVGWTVGVEVIEDRRIPSSADIMAIYQADLGDDGELVGYRRIRRYKRGQGDTDYNGESW